LTEPGGRRSGDTIVFTCFMYMALLFGEFMKQLLGISALDSRPLACTYDDECHKEKEEHTRKGSDEYDARGAEGLGIVGINISVGSVLLSTSCGADGLILASAAIGVGVRPRIAAIRFGCTVGSIGGIVRIDISIFTFF